MYSAVRWAVAVMAMAAVFGSAPLASALLKSDFSSTGTVRLDVLSEQSDGQDTDKPDGPEPQNGLLYCYEATNITGERVVNRSETQLKRRLIASWHD